MVAGSTPTPDTMTDYGDALDRQSAVRILKHQLPIAFVLAYAELGPQQVGTRVRAQCPFHEDHDPSLEVWLEEDGSQRWGCWPCGKRGDVIDLLRWLWQLNFTDAVAAGRNLMTAASGWAGPTPASGSSWDGPGAAAMLLDAYKHFDAAAVQSLIDLKGWKFRPAFLRDLLVGTAKGRLVVPYFDTMAELVAVKHRALDGSGGLWAFPGSQLRNHLYLEHGQDTGNPYLICEGESDAWTALSAGAKLEVRGLPSGAGTPPQPFIDRLRGRRVYLALDGDDAGDQGAERWQRTLGPTSEVVRLEIPRGYDLSSLDTVNWLHDLI